MSNATIQPAVCHVHRALCITVIARIRRAFIKSHDDIGTNGTLNFHYVLWSKHVKGAVDMRFEFYPFFLDFSVGRKRIYLITAGVREDITVPIHEFMQSACFF